MANKFSLKSLMDTDIIYVAPILVFVSLFHVFSTEPATHSFGQIEIYCALALSIYYLWDKIAVVYSPEKILKKRIEAIVCAIAGVLLLMIPLPILMTWQYYNLYKNSDRYSLNKQIAAAIIAIWVGIAAIFGSFYTLNSQRMAAQTQDATAAESSYIAPTEGQ